MAFITEKSLKPKILQTSLSIFSISKWLYHKFRRTSCWIHQLELARIRAGSFQIANSRKIPALKNYELRGLSTVWCEWSKNRTIIHYIVFIWQDNIRNQYPISQNLARKKGPKALNGTLGTGYRGYQMNTKIRGRGTV